MMKKMTKMKKYNEVVEIENGIMSHIPNDIWKDRYQDFDLDLEFFFKYGERAVAPMINHFLGEDGKLSDESLDRIGNLIYRKYKEQWTRKYSVLDVVYSMTENYDMKETESVDREVLEETINTLIATNTQSNQQVTDLVNILKATISNTDNKTGTDKTDGSNQNTNTETINLTNAIETVTNEDGTLSFIDRRDTETHDNSTSQNINQTVDRDGTDSLSFVNRKDTETRNLETAHNINQTVTGDNSDELSFVNRKDKESRNIATGGTQTDDKTITGTNTTTFNNRKDTEDTGNTKTTQINESTDTTNNDTLTFTDRKDTESRDLSKSGSVTKDLSRDGTDTLTFTGRTDTETRDLTKSGSDNNTLTRNLSDKLTFTDRRDTNNKDATVTDNSTENFDG